MSCGSETFCVALSDHVVGPTKSTYALVYDGNNWSEPREVDPEAALQSVSCSSSSMCMAVGEHDSVTYWEGAWSAPELPTPKASSGGVLYFGAVLRGGHGTLFEYERRELRRGAYIQRLYLERPQRNTPRPGTRTIQR